MSDTSITTKRRLVRARRGDRRPWIEFLEPRVLLTAYVVSSPADDGGTGTLRWAIAQVNANAGPSAIQFAIPGTGVQRIALLSPLPMITKPVLIDGTTEPNYAGHPLIQIDGSAAGSSCDGLVLAGGQSVVQGLIVSRFSVRHRT